MQKVRFLVLGVLVGAAAVLGIVFGPLYWISDSTTVQSLSPNDQYRIHLVEIGSRIPLNIDRNFELRLENRTTDEFRTIFSSPDEGYPVGSERFIWSTDSNYFLLVGRHFLVKDSNLAGHGEQAYLLYHLPSGRILLNDGKEALTKERLETIDFLEPLFCASD